MIFLFSLRRFRGVVLPGSLLLSCGMIGFRFFLFLLFFIQPVFSRADTDVSKWYRGNTHTHSLWSDGNDFPEMIVDWYHRNGYDFIALSDHDILAEGKKVMTVQKIKARQRAIGRDAISKCIKRFGEEWIEWEETEKGEKAIVLKTLEAFRGKFEKPGEFYIMTAEEISNNSKSGPVHINALNLKTKIPSIKSKEIDTREVMRRTLRAVAEQEEKTGKPILAHLNHPNFRWAVTAQDLAEVTEEEFFEVYNGHPIINHLGDETRPGDEKIWDIVNTVRLGEMDVSPMLGLATDDSHTYHGGDVSPGRGWIVVGAERLDGDSLIKAMRAGKFYASSGVFLKTLDYDPVSRKLSFSIQPDGDAAFVTELIGTRKGPASKIEIGEVFAKIEGDKVSYTVPKGVLYMRATITSSARHRNPSFQGQRKQAWIQPVGWRK